MTSKRLFAEPCPDQSGEYPALWNAPAQLQVTSDPPGAKITLQRYAKDGDRLRLDPVGDLGTTPLADKSLDPGSYVLHLELPGRVSVGYPVALALTPTVLRAARARTRWLTLGIDMIWGDDSRPQPHVELVAIVDVERGSVIGWTGKSYPTLDQERLLIQAPPDSHFVTLSRRRVLVLGCHDLNMYNPRGFANQNAASPRRRRCTLFRRLCQEFSPSIVVQHPHTTDSPRIWQNGWAALREKLPTVQYWASGIFYDEESDPRGDLDDVLRSTRSPSGVLDLPLEGT